MAQPREPLNDYPDSVQSYAYATQGYGYGYGGGNEYGGMAGYDAQTSWWGSGWGPGELAGGGAVNVAAYPTKAGDLKGQLILATGTSTYRPEAGIVLSKAIDDVMVRLGPAAYTLMMNDPVINAAVEIVVLGIVGDKHEVVPRVVAEPGEDVGAEGDRAALVARAKKYAEECERMLGAMGRPFRETLRMTVRDKLVYGSSLAEHDWARVKDGPDAGVVRIAHCNPKPHPSWAFVVDPYLEVKGIWGWTASGPVVIDVDDKFLVQTWCPLNSDPRGSSLLRPCFDPWSFKSAAKPFRAKFLSLHSDPTIIVYYDPAQAGRPNYPLGPDGQPDESQRPLTPIEMAVAIAANFHSGSYAALPIGWKIELIEAKATGDAFDKADEGYNREITQTILLSSRATQEAKNSSKADNEGATDFSKMRLDYGRHATCDAIEAAWFYRYVLRNYGKAEADLLTPRLSLSQAQKGDHASLITAYKGAGWGLIPRQKAAIDAELGLPVRTADEIAREQQQADQAKQAATEAQAGKADKEEAQAGRDGGKPGSGGKPGEPGQPAAPAPPKGVLDADQQQGG